MWIQGIFGHLNEYGKCLLRVWKVACLHNSWTKTKIQNIGAGPPARTVMVGGQQVEGAENFTYLGCQWSFVDVSRTEQVQSNNVG